MPIQALEHAFSRDADCWSATLVFSNLMELLRIAPVRFTTFEQVPVFAIVFRIFDKSPAFVFGAFFYHWPRRLETARFALTVIALPLVLTILQFLAAQAFGR